jgi:hypothetical protein
MIIYKLIYGTSVRNHGTIPWNLGEERKENRMIVNDIEIHYICADRGYNDMY